MPATVWYATREDVKRAAASKETARNNEQVDRAIAAASESIENDLLYRRFYPEVATRFFDWPGHVDRRDGSRIVSLGRDELVSLTQLTVESVPVASEHWTLLPTDGPPYTAIELDSTVTLSGATGRRAVAATGPYGYWDREDLAGTLASAVADTVTTSVTVSNGAAVGVGHLLLVGAERMIITGRSMVDSGQNTTATLAGSVNAEQLQVGSGAAFIEGEVVLVDAEKMLVVDIAGNTLIVKRAWDGSTLADHASGVDVYAPRRLTVQRGALGTTAATHLSGAALTVHEWPSLVNQLCVAEALVGIAQENITYGRTVGSGDAERDAPGAGLEDLRRRAWEAHGRQRY